MAWTIYFGRPSILTLHVRCILMALVFKLITFSTNFYTCLMWYSYFLNYHLHPENEQEFFNNTPENKFQKLSSRWLQILDYWPFDNLKAKNQPFGVVSVEKHHHRWEGSITLHQGFKATLKWVKVRVRVQLTGLTFFFFFLNRLFNTGSGLPRQKGAVGSWKIWWVLWESWVGRWELWGFFVHRGIRPRFFYFFGSLHNTTIHCLTEYSYHVM